MNPKLFIANILSLTCIPKCILCSRARQCLASSVKCDEKELWNDNAPTYLSTQINICKEMDSCMHACSHRHATIQYAQIPMHTDLLKVELRTWCYTMNPKSVCSVFVFTDLCLLSISNSKCCQKPSGINPPEE